MSILTKAQIIEKNGKPIFAVIPYEDYLALRGERRYKFFVEKFMKRSGAAHEIRKAIRCKAKGASQKAKGR